MYLEVPSDVTKITFEPEENKVLCTTGNNHLCFWHIFENTVKPFKNIKDLNVVNNNFVDHGLYYYLLLDWVKGEKNLLVAINDKNEIYVLERFLENTNEQQKFNLNIEQVRIRQHIMNCFGSNPYINSSIVRSYQKGLIIGSQQGNLLFVEKVNNSGQLYKPIRFTSRGKNYDITKKSLVK